MKTRISLEPEAIAVSNSSSNPPLIFELPPWQGRQVLEEAQNTPIHMYSANLQKMVMDTGKWESVRVYMVCPPEIQKPCNVIRYFA